MLSGVMEMRICFVISVVLAGATISSVLAQSMEYTSVETTVGAIARLGFYASIKRDCSPGPLPTITVRKPPKHGSLVVRTGAVATNRVAACPGVKVPALIVFYRSQADYVGTDDVVYDVKESEGRDKAFSVIISVKRAAQPNAPSYAQPL
jgi:hypothetical protein